MKSKFILLHTFLLFVSMVGFFNSEVQAMPTRITLQDNGKATCKITVLKSTGELQHGVYAKVFGNYEKFEADEKGIITVEYTSSSYSHTVSLYFYHGGDQYKKTFTLDTEKDEMTVYFDSLEDVQNYKRTARLFPIDGMVVDNEGNPLEQVTVSIQGTGRRTLTDEMGLFQLDADFNHPIVIRGDGMRNISLPITHFLQGDDEQHTITMYPKNAFEVYSSVEQMPEFPGGMKAFQHYLDKNLEYPEKAKKAKIEGVVVVQFVVEKSGAITSPKIMRRLETTLDSAAWRAIKQMPNWIPASDYGRTVRCKYSVPVAFKIPVPKPIQPIDSLKLMKDSLALDSIASDSLLNDSMRLRKGLLADSLKRDSLLNDSIQKMLPTDSLQKDSTRIIMDKDQPVVKAKKRNIFVRFFRWLFGIERRQRKRAEREMASDSIASVGRKGLNADTFNAALDSLKRNNKVKMTIHEDSIRMDIDSLNINVKELGKKAEKLLEK